MSELLRIITARDPEVRNRPLEAFCRDADTAGLLAECEALERFRRESDNLYERVRAQFFLYAIHRFHLPAKPGVRPAGPIPFAAYQTLMKRRFEETVDILLRAQAADGPTAAISSGLAAAYRSLGFQTLANQVRRSVRSVRGNQWLARIGHPADYPLSVRPELLALDGALYPVLREATPVRMDLSHSGWSDIFFLQDRDSAIRQLETERQDLELRRADQQAQVTALQAKVASLQAHLNAIVPSKNMYSINPNQSLLVADGHLTIGLVGSPTSNGIYININGKQQFAAVGDIIHVAPNPSTACDVQIESFDMFKAQFTASCGGPTKTE